MTHFLCHTETKLQTAKSTQIVENILQIKPENMKSILVQRRAVTTIDSQHENANNVYGNKVPVNNRRRSVPRSVVDDSSKTKNHSADSSLLSHSYLHPVKVTKSV